jgi:hypothetical protein
MLISCTSQSNNLSLLQFKLVLAILEPWHIGNCEISEASPIANEA